MAATPSQSTEVYELANAVAWFEENTAALKILDGGGRFQ
jgi:hypothetical protein